jgi:hypothetical protein
MITTIPPSFARNSQQNKLSSSELNPDCNPITQAYKSGDGTYGYLSKPWQVNPWQAGTWSLSLNQSMSSKNPQGLFWAEVKERNVLSHVYWNALQASSFQRIGPQVCSQIAQFAKEGQH